MRGLRPIPIVLCFCVPPPEAPTPPQSEPIAIAEPAPSAIAARPADAPAKSPTQEAPPAASGVYQVGLATWYGQALAGHATASGERFNPQDYTAAHRTLPFGTLVEVRRRDTGQGLIVRINDRGPFDPQGQRIIDVSSRAATDLGFLRAGVVLVELRVVRLGP